MRTSIFVATTVLQWLVLIIMGVSLLVWLATTVELMGRAQGSAIWTGFLQMPGILIRLLPLCVLLGVALAVARMELKSERRALWLLGHGVGRTGAVVAMLGLVLGLTGLGLQGGTVSKLELEALRQTSPVEVGWVWVNSRAIRVSDGRVVSVESSSLLTETTNQDGAHEHPEAWISLRPELADNAQLMNSRFPLEQVELQGRVARGLACGLLAFWAWLPTRRRWRSDFWEVLALGLGWSLLELIMLGLARARAVPVEVGAWLPLMTLGLLCVVRLFQCQQSPQSRTQM